MGEREELGWAWSRTGGAARPPLVGPGGGVAAAAVPRGEAVPVVGEAVCRPPPYV
jgi:hypothetical protein